MHFSEVKMKYDKNAITFKQLAALSREEATELFLECEAPGPVEMDGEYKGLVLDYFRPNFFASSDLNKCWFGKAYTPESILKGWEGRGYNIYQIEEVRELRSCNFPWSIKPSRLDGKPSLVMDYTKCDNGAGDMGLIDEVRKVREGLYLCGFYTEKANPPFTVVDGQYEFFILRGPARKWIGPDIMERVKG